MPRAEIVNGFGGSETADASRLDVDDLPAAERDHVARSFDVGDRLVETDRRRHPPLQLGVAERSSRAERLLEHQQAELVELTR